MIRLPGTPSSFFAAHVALLVGVTTPEKFYFNEVHYVPAARQMLEPVMPTPALNPMHPPLAKQPACSRSRHSSAVSGSSGRRQSRATPI